MVASSQELTSIAISSIGFFGLAYNVSSSLLKKLTKIPGFALDEKHVPALLSQGPSYVVSFLHCFSNGIRGCLHFKDIFGADTTVKLFFPPTPPAYENCIRNIEVSNVIFFSFLVVDIYHVLRAYPKLGGLDVVIHHLVFLCCSMINGIFGILPFAFCWLIIGELSTIFLNVRWGLIKTGRGDTQAFQVVQYLFALTFFLTRVLFYSAGLFELFLQRDGLREIVNDRRAPETFLLITLFFIACGWLLNVVWFRKIAAMAFMSETKTKHKNK